MTRTQQNSLVSRDYSQGSGGTRRELVDVLTREVLR